MLFNSLFYSLLLVSRGVCHDSTHADHQQQPLGQKSEPEFDLFDDGFETMVNKTLAYWHVPGISIAVITPKGISAKVGIPIILNCYLRL